MSDLQVISKLPLNLNEDTLVADADSNIYSFDREAKNWQLYGRMNVSIFVSNANDGIITADVFNRLETISVLNFDSLKLSPGVDSYWYYFRSSTELLRFDREDDNTLRIEVDRRKLNRLFYTTNCYGERGDTGAIGLQGAAGLPGEPEPKRDFIIIDDKLTFDFEVTTRSDANFSFRLFNVTDDLLLVDVIFNAVSVVSISSDLISVDNFIYTITTIAENRVRIVGHILNFNINSYFKCQQLGVKGPAGVNGGQFLEIVERNFSDDLLAAEEMLVSVRRTGRTLRLVRDTLNDVNCVQFLERVNSVNDITQFRLDENASGSSGEAIFKQISFVNLVENFKSCRSLGVYNYTSETFKRPYLVHGAWTPMVNCFNTRNWYAGRYAWWEGTHTLDTSLWASCDGDSKQMPYPWRILAPSYPETRCCSEDFFFCPNVRDKECATNVRGMEQPALVPTLPTTHGCCTCPNPIEYVAQDGYEFDDMVLNCDITDLSGNSSVQQRVISVVNGLRHRYLLRILNEATQTTDLGEPISGCTFNAVFTLAFDINCESHRQRYGCNDNPTKCGCKTYATCPVVWQVQGSRSTIGQRNVTWDLLSPQFQTATQVGSLANDTTLSFFIDKPGEFLFEVIVNTTLQNCCLAYSLFANVVRNG